jgi:carboxyl-terminal processing protease
LIALVVEGSPASRENLRKKDRITAIDGKSLDGKTLEEAVALLHGDNGVPVVLSIERGASDKFNVTIVRNDYVIPVVHFKDLGDGISYIKLDDFMSQFSVKEMFNALNKAAKGKAVILDLRGNHGGSLSYVEKMAEFFLEEGTILEQHQRQDDNLVTLRLAVQPHFALRTETSSAEPDSTGVQPEDRMLNLLPKDMPVVVLVDDDSYSASEILAGALQATHRAVVVGLPTGGKGVGQLVVKLPFGRSMHVTNFEFLPGGQAMDWVGVIPNIEVKQPANFDEDDASTDAQLKAAQTQVKSMLDAQAQLQLKRDGLRKKNEDDFKKSREGK